MKSILNLPQRLSFFMATTIWSVCILLLLLFGLLFYQIENLQQKHLLEQATLQMADFYMTQQDNIIYHIENGHIEDMSLDFEPSDLRKAIIGIWVMDSNHTVLKKFGEPIPVLPKLSTTPPGKTDKPRTNSFFTQIDNPDRSSLIFYRNITKNGTPLGYFYLEFNPTAIKAATQRQLVLSISGAVCIFLLAAIYLQMFFSNSLFKPMMLLKTAIFRIGQGQLGKTTAFAVKNEIGDLIADINALSNQLKAGHQCAATEMEKVIADVKALEEINRKIARLNADLEGLVEERTRQLQVADEALNDKEQLYL